MHMSLVDLLFFGDNFFCSADSEGNFFFSADSEGQYASLCIQIWNIT